MYWICSRLLFHQTTIKPVNKVNYLSQQSRCVFLLFGNNNRTTLIGDRRNKKSKQLRNLSRSGRYSAPALAKSFNKIGSLKLFLHEKFRIGFSHNYEMDELKYASNVLLSNLLNNVEFTKLLNYGSLDNNIVNWSRIVHLHMWMFEVRLLKEGIDGKILHRKLVIGMFKDIYRRLKCMRTENMVYSVDKTLKNMAAHGKTSLIFYEYGIVDDKKLAEALWNNLYGGSQGDCTNPMNIENWINYIRFTMNYLEEQEMNDIVKNSDSLIWKLPPDMIQIN